MQCRWTMGEDGIVFNYTFDSCLFLLNATELCRNMFIARRTFVWIARCNFFFLRVSKFICWSRLFTALHVIATNKATGKIFFAIKIVTQADWPIGQKIRDVMIFAHVSWCDKRKITLSSSWFSDDGGRLTPRCFCVDLHRSHPSRALTRGWERSQRFSLSIGGPERL